MIASRGDSKRSRRMQGGPGFGRGGFTLISVIVAVALLTIGVLALSRTTTSVTYAQTSATSRTIALSIARAHMERVRSRNPWTLVPEAPVRVDATGALDAEGEFLRSVDVFEEAPNLLRVTIEVAYPRGIDPVKLVTLIYRGTS
jgi:Tfp pilus assembly protein PilE